MKTIEMSIAQLENAVDCKQFSDEASDTILEAIAVLRDATTDPTDHVSIILKIVK